MDIIKTLKKTTKDFFSSKFNTYLVILLLITAGFAFINTIEEPIAPIDHEKIEIHFFYTPTCPYCGEQKPIIQEIELERTDVQVFKHDASSTQGSTKFYELSAEIGLDTSRMAVPTTFVGKHALIGLQSKENIINAIDECINSCEGEEYQTENKQGIKATFTEFDVPFIGKTDLTQWSLPVLAIVLGLIDGFNPCALWVLIFLITLLMGEKSKKKIWLVVGSFVIASAISYFIFMTAWLNMFLLLGYIRILSIIIGVFALGMGVLQLKEWYLNKDGTLTCNVGDEESHEKTMTKIQNVVSQPITIGIIISIIALAFTVNAIEFVCSAAIPAVFTQLLALSNLTTFQHYLYITIYVFFYMLDHIIIFGMAALALGSGQMQKYAKWCKLIGGTLMFIIGVLLLFAPHLLR